MKIAVTSQDRNTITAHAGMCRRFWIYAVDDGQQTGGKTLLELSKEQSLHESHGAGPHPLDAVNVLIAGGMGSGLADRLARRGIRALVTSETDPDRAVAAFVAGRLDDARIFKRALSAADVKELVPPKLLAYQPSPANGAVALNADGSFIYTPNPGFSGSDGFLYAAHDGTAASAAATVSVTVGAAGPDAVDILTATYTQKTKKLHVEATSSAQPEAVLTVVGYGDMTWNATAGPYILDKRITAAPGDHVKVTSSRGGVDYYYFNGGSNVPPVANDQSVTVLMGTPKAITLTATDANGDPLTYSVMSLPAHGTLSGTAPNLTYTSSAGYEVADSFTFKANDGQIDSAIATVSITVSASEAEEVLILVAEYRTKTRQLTVHATSSLQPAVTMELFGYGPMTYDPAQARYVFSKKVSTAPGAEVTVRSSGNVSATAPVTFK